MSDTHHAAAFPAASYAAHILEPAFGFARDELFGPLTLANQAHALMLVEQGILDPTSGARLLAAINLAGAEGAASFTYAPAVEDLFFAVEQRVIALAGPDAGGNLQLARSRNDLDAVMIRLALRERLLRAAEQLLALRQALLARADEGVDIVMPGVTHAQEAQPTTLAHYLLGVLGPLGRDADRLRLAFAHVNQSPLGAAAFTTTSFPIDRRRVAELLGFDGIVENGYDAVGAADYMAEVGGVLRVCALSLARFVTDLLIWSRSEVGVARVGEAFIQISSIMPQKRNPVVLEHIRARVGYVLGDAATVEALIHTASYGDTVDIEDPIYVPLLRCCDSASSVLTLLSDVLRSIQFDAGKLRGRVEASFGASTELAETLTRDHGLSFRQAHAVAARVVRALAAAGADLRDATPEQIADAARETTGREITLRPDELADAIDPAGFVARRAVLGGPAPAAVRDALARELDSQRAFATWITDQRTTIDAALARLGALARDQASNQTPSGRN